MGRMEGRLQFHRALAWVNIVWGGLMTLLVLGLVVLARPPDDASLGVVALVLLPILALLGLGFAWGGVRHLRHPDRRSALALAANTAVLIWILAGTLGRLLHLDRWLGPVDPLVGLLVAFVIYRARLRPRAMRDFPD